MTEAERIYFAKLLSFFYVKNQFDVPHVKGSSWDQCPHVMQNEREPVT